MTDSEFQKLLAECREHLRLTSFPPSPIPEDEYECRSRHAEFEAARH